LRTGKRESLRKNLENNFKKASKIKKNIYEKITDKTQRDYIDVLLKNHIMELHNQEMDFQLNKQAKMIDQLNLMVKKQRGVMKKHGVKMEEADNWVLDEKEIIEDWEERISEEKP
jgi:predicted RNA binding protein with dsRBD fold (UPF0201 family)